MYICIYLIFNSSVNGQLAKFFELKKDFTYFYSPPGETTMYYYLDKQQIWGEQEAWA